MDLYMTALKGVVEQSGFVALNLPTLIMLLVAFILLYLAIAVFVLAWIAQFIGHKIEGKKPSFLTDLTYLLIGPVWVLSKFYRKMGWKY